MVCTNHTNASQDPYSPDDVVTGGCLTAGHKLYLADGSLRNIEDMTIGDIVKTLQEDCEVVDTFHYKKEVVELELESNQIINATNEHHFLVIENGEQIWKSVSELNVGDEIIATNPVPPDNILSK
jgi:intein/homing endonuclease